jgi:hypothetical protein
MIDQVRVHVAERTLAQSKPVLSGSATRGGSGFQRRCSMKRIFLKKSNSTPNLAVWSSRPPVAGAAAGRPPPGE